MGFLRHPTSMEKETFLLKVRKHSIINTHITIEKKLNSFYYYYYYIIYNSRNLCNLPIYLCHYYFSTCLLLVMKNCSLDINFFNYISFMIGTFSSSFANFLSYGFNP